MRLRRRARPATWYLHAGRERACHSPRSCASTTSIQCRTGTGLACRRCSRQPMFAVATTCGASTSSAATLRRAQFVGECRLQDRVRSRRSATQRRIAHRYEFAARGAQQGFDLAGGRRALTVLSEQGACHATRSAGAMYVAAASLRVMASALRSAAGSITSHRSRVAPLTRAACATTSAPSCRKASS